MAFMLPGTSQRLAQFKVYFLEDNAVSLNGRQYPTESVERLVQSAQVTLSDPSALPMTCYLSHDDAYMDATRHLVGTISGVGREDSRAYAYLNISDTEAGRDLVTLARDKAIRTVSLRAANAEMYVNNNNPLPLVGGQNLRLEGIDFTTSPGLPQIARIADITESRTPQSLNEIFQISKNLLIEESSASPKKEPPMTDEEKAAIKAALLEELKTSLPPAILEQKTPDIDEARRILVAAGHIVQSPKTTEQLWQEKLDAMQATFDRKLQETLDALKPSVPVRVGRRSLVEGSTESGQPKRPYYRNGDYLREQLHDPTVLAGLLDRSRPLPEGMNSEYILKELEVQLLGIIDHAAPFDGSVILGG
jgi:hypothetical protein